MNKKIIASIAILALSIPFTISCNRQDADCKKIREQYKTFVHDTTDLEEYGTMSIGDIQAQLDPVKINGIETCKFNDVDYTNDGFRADWPAREHLSRTLKIAIRADNENSKELRDIAKKLTYHWVLSNYHHINWWHNELGANPTLANIGLFTFDYLGKKGIDALNGKVRESSLKYRPAVSTHTGANLFDYVDITCRDAALNNDKDEMNIAFDRFQKEIVDTNKEGFQKDGSFFQHGRQVQNVSYGKAVMRIAKTLYCLRGTSYKMPDDKMKILNDYIIRGLRASTFRGYTNYTTVSRAYDRVNFLDTQNDTDSSFNDLRYFNDVENFPDKENLMEFVNSLQDRKNAVSEDTIFYFPIAKMIVANIGHSNNSEGVYISYKGTAPEITNTECNNRENVLGMNLSYGTNTCVMDTGKEYFNISPVMDYENMPGTTAITYGGDNALKTFAKDVYNDFQLVRQVPEADSTNGFIYNDGQQDGVTYMLTRTEHHDRAKFTVTCFATMDGMVLLGSDFSYTPESTDPSVEDTNMHTTLDQYITDDGESTTSNLTTTRNHSNGNVKYTMLDGHTFTKTIVRKEYGPDEWKRNHETLVTTDSGVWNVATIKLDGNTDKYAYAIEPYSDGDSKFKLAYNGNNIHAIELPNGKIAAAFYSKDNLSFNYSEHDYSINQSEFIDGKGAFKIFDKQ